jgi:putative Holliday junction resolvase
MKYLGLDWGKSKIGVALASSEMRIASPILIFKYKNLAEVKTVLEKLIAEEDIEKIVVGKPLKLSGRENFAQEFIDFSTLIEGFGKEVFYEDERMSTKAFTSLNRQFDVKNDGNDDAGAAATILQGYLDRTA